MELFFAGLCFNYFTTCCITSLSRVGPLLIFIGVAPYCSGRCVLGHREAGASTWFCAHIGLLLHSVTSARWPKAMFRPPFWAPFSTFGSSSYPIAFSVTGVKRDGKKSVLVGCITSDYFLQNLAIPFHRKLKQLFFLFWGGLFAYAVTVERLQFLTRAELLFFMIYCFAAVRLVMSTLLSRRTKSTILEGQMLGTVDIMEGTCSQAWKVLHLYLFSFSVSVSVCSACWCAWFAPCPRFSLCGASAMKVIAWTCAPATASDLESPWRSISFRTRRMVNCAWEGWRANRSLHLGTEAKDKPNHLTAGSLRCFPHENWNWTALSGKADDWRNRERAVFDIFSNFKWVNSQGFLWWICEARDGPHGPFMVSRTLSMIDEPNIRSRCSRNVKNHMFYWWKTSPCVRSKRRHAFGHHAHMCFNMCAWCRYTRGHFESTHGGFFYACQAAPHTTPHKTHTHHTNHAHQHETTHGDTDRDRDRDRDRERRENGRWETRQEKRRQKKTRQDKRREKIHFQCGGAWPFFVDVVIFWLIPFAHETWAS